MLNTAALYWHTLRHLRPVQLIGRLRYRLSNPVPDEGVAPKRRDGLKDWQTPAARPSSLTGPNSFNFLDSDGDLTADGWDNPDRSKLWRYNLHYFDDLNAAGNPDRENWQRNFMEAWIAENPPGKGTGWEPYPVSLRIVNWVKWALSGSILTSDAHQSLAVQARWLTKRLEWHLMGNHLFSNAKALLHAGRYFDGAEACAFRHLALSILSQEIREQILLDGAQFELSPMYHALAVEDLLDITNLMTAYRDQLFSAETELLKPQ